MMIKKEDFVAIGQVGKAHGLQGELSCKLSVDISELIAEEEDFFLMLEEQDLLIPYRVVAHRSKAGEIDLLHFAWVNSKEEAELLTNRKIWLSREYMPDEELSDDPYDFERYIGFEVYDEEEHSLVGRVQEVDSSTINTLLYIERTNGEELILPIADELLASYNDEERWLSLHIPQGLLNDDAELID